MHQTKPVTTSNKASDDPPYFTKLRTSCRNPPWNLSSNHILGIHHFILGRIISWHKLHNYSAYSFLQPSAIISQQAFIQHLTHRKKPNHKSNQPTSFKVNFMSTVEQTHMCINALESTNIYILLSHCVLQCVVNCLLNQVLFIRSPRNFMGGA